MISLLAHALAITVVLSAILSCQDSSLSGGNSQRRQVQDLPPEGDGAEAGGSDCIEGDRITLQLPAAVQECMDGGKLYHFQSEICLTVETATFSCDFEAMAEQVDSIGVNNETLLQAREGGAFLVSCGEKNDGNTVVAQWYYPPSDDLCKDDNPSSRIVTACYKLFARGEAPSLETEEDREQALAACLAE